MYIFAHCELDIYTAHMNQEKFRYENKTWNIKPCPSIIINTPFCDNNYVDRQIN